AGAPHRIVEIEVYWNGAAHCDPFAHGDPIQRRFGVWYFHRSGGHYRGGTYKGLDIAFGRDDVAAGILIRGLERPDGTLVDGPCMCVDYLLSRTGHATVQALAESFDLAVDDPGGTAPLHLTLVDPPRRAPVYASPRIGLSLKRGALAQRARFLARPYRFLTEPTRIKKGRPHLVIGLHRQGLDAAAIAAVVGSTVAPVSRYIAQYEAGRGRDPRDFVKDLTSDETCRLLGACEPFTDP
ncbi:MAG TPA: hypothetical protein VIK91_12410, partial [Nannocystis sp.]